MGYRSTRPSGPPNWFIFLLGVAFIFAIYYMWNNLRDFMRAGGLSIAEATRQAEVASTATQAQRVVIQAARPTPRPTSTEKPPCIEFEVTAASGIVRRQASTAAAFVESLERGTIICVLAQEEAGDGFTWYLIDLDPITRRIEVGYMREDIVRPSDPTPTPTVTRIAPSITPLLTNTPRPTVTRVTRQPTADDVTTDTPTPRITAPPTLSPTPAATETNMPPGIGV